jgi:hypothetical protein
MLKKNVFTLSDFGLYVHQGLKIIRPATQSLGISKIILAFLNFSG